MSIKPAPLCARRDPPHKSLRAHKGLYNAIFFATVCISRIMDESRMRALTWSFGWYRTAAYALSARRSKTTVVPENPSRKTDSGSRQSRERSGERNASREHGGTQAETEARPFDYAVWDEVLGQLTAHCTVYKTITLTQKRSSGRAAIRDATPSTARRSTPAAAVSPKSPVMKIRPGSNASAAGSIAFHTGTWGGIWTKILYFLAALIGASLP